MAIDELGPKTFLLSRGIKMKISTVLSVTFCALTLSACAIPHPQMVWAPEKGKSESAFHTDRFECLKISDASNAPAVMVAHDPLIGSYQYDASEVNRDQLFAACMNAKGWKFIPAAVSQH